MCGALGVFPESGWGNKWDRLLGVIQNWVSWTLWSCVSKSVSSHLISFLLVTKIQNYGLIIFQSIWILCGNWEVNRQLIHKVAPCDSNQSERNVAAKRKNHNCRFLFSVWISHCGNIKVEVDVWGITSECKLCLCISKIQVRQSRALEPGADSSWLWECRPHISDYIWKTRELYGYWAHSPANTREGMQFTYQPN